MPGFCISHPYLLDDNITLNKNLAITNMEKINDTIMFQSSIKKFENDKIFEVDEQYALILDGCLLNKGALFKSYNVNNLHDLLITMYDQGRNVSFFKEFRGPFCGAIFDRKKERWIVYTNHTGEKSVYYYSSPSGFIISTSLELIYEICKRNSVTLTVDEGAIYQTLTFGFFEDNSTFAKEIRRLRGGSYLLIQNGKCDIDYYHTFSKDCNQFSNSTEAEIIDAIDNSFRNAVKMAFEKDVEYSYRHIGDMSGGLDSRMNIWVAHELGVNDVQLLTYCKSNYQDEIIAKQIAAYWKDPIIVRSLDDLRFFYDVNEIVDMNGGTSSYIGITGGKRLLDIIDWEKFGIEHNGLIGDVVLGSFFRNQTEIDQRVFSGRFSEKLAHRLIDNKYKEAFFDQEIYVLYSRGFQGACNTVQIRNYYTEAWSPFLDPEFLQLCMNIPIELRAGHYIYKKWILTKYPEAAQYRWETINGLITESEFTIKLRKLIERGPKALLRKLGITPNSSDNGMNPLDYWVETDQNVATYLNTYLKEAEEKCRSIISKQLFDDAHNLFDTGTAMEKCMVITAYAALKKMLF